MVPVSSQSFLNREFVTGGATTAAGQYLPTHASTGSTVLGAWQATGGNDLIKIN